jgi:lipid II:glycine glycyltransferase (peptidoglycan interpeptide bridge formation enzyme)
VSRALDVRPISRAEHERYIASLPSASFLQCPSWGEVKSDWRAESIGWFDTDGALHGAGLVLYRQVPKLKRYLAYLPEGPTIDWTDDDLGRWLTPMVAHLKTRGAFAVKIGPRVETRHWEAATVKQAIADKTPSLRQTPPDWLNPDGERVAAGLRRLGWRPPQAGKGFAAGQPQYVFQLPLEGSDDDRILKGFNQLWRRNVKKADKAGVKVTQGSYNDLAAFHDVYRETAERDGFHPRPLSYFQRMWQAMRAEDGDRIRLYLAHHEGLLLAATTMVRVGTHAWYSYGASSNEGRDVRPSNAIQWQMMRDARDAGASVYDLRGITDTLDPDDKLFGLIQFKVGTGGRAVEYLGEWDLPVNRPLAKAFDLYMARRG